LHAGWWRNRSSCQQWRGRVVTMVERRAYACGCDWTLRCIQVVDAGVDKQYGVEQMLRYADLSDCYPLKIGNGWNDFALFDAAGGRGIKVAMGNAPGELKDLADWVAPSVEDHGFAVAMERYDLLRRQG
jgi:hydroxymethylpyrimidine pyrophosphatase-like HAD family hydrolase